MNSSLPSEHGTKLRKYHSRATYTQIFGNYFELPGSYLSNEDLVPRDKQNNEAEPNFQPQHPSDSAEIDTQAQLAELWERGAS
jgi:hypothetical protein